MDWEEEITSKPLYSNDKLAVDLLGPSPDLRHNLFLERGTHAPVVYQTTHYLILVRELNDIPTPPDNMEPIVVFNITPVGAEFDRDIFLTLGLNQEQLPENTRNVTMAYYDDISGVWEWLDGEAGEPNSAAELTWSAPINHFSIYGILAEVEPTTIPPARFAPSDLSVVPSVVRIWEPITFLTKTGESVTITFNLLNDGGQAGYYPLVLELDGELVETRTVTLAAGQSQQVEFTSSRLAYGEHKVEVAGLSKTFTTSRTVSWWLIIIIIAAVGLIVWGVVRRRRRRRKARQEA